MSAVDWSELDAALGLTLPPPTGLPVPTGPTMAPPPLHGPPLPPRRRWWRRRRRGPLLDEYDRGELVDELWSIVWMLLFVGVVGVIVWFLGEYVLIERTEP